MSKKQEARINRLRNLRYTIRVMLSDTNSQMAKSLFRCWVKFPRVQAALRKRFNLEY